MMLDIAAFTIAIPNKSPCGQLASSVRGDKLAREWRDWEI